MKIKHTQKTLTSGLEVFKTAENPWRLVNPLSSFLTFSSLFEACVAVSLDSFFIDHLIKK